MGIIVRTNYENEDAWNAWCAKLKDAEKELMTPDDAEMADVNEASGSGGASASGSAQAGSSTAPQDSAEGDEMEEDGEDEDEDEEPVLPLIEATPKKDKKKKRKAEDDAMDVDEENGTPEKKKRKLSKEEKKKEKDTLRHRSRKSVDGNTGRGGERLSIFGGMPLGRSRKPPPKYNPYVYPFCTFASLLTSS